MWTIVWTDNHGNEHYDRPVHKDEVIEMLKKLRNNDHLDDDAILVFPPDTEADIDALIGVGNV